MADQSLEILGGYTLLERIGKGGMGEVWRAERVTGGSVRRRAAVKRILPEYQRDPTLRERFTAEARITSRLEHPNVVQVLDFGETPELYLVLEYIDGVSLSDVLRRSAKQPGKFPVAAVLHIVAEAATGLDYAHRRTDEAGQPLGIVHRDVSPANVMVSVDGAVKVNDFGIARAADNIVRTQAGMAIGKLVYMAPEQAGGERVDRRADVFALGIVLWELLTRKPLLPRGDPSRTLEALARCDFPPPSSVVPGVPPECDAIVREALMRDPERRTPSAARVSKALRMLLSTIAPGFEGRDLARALIELMPELAARASNVSFTAAMPQMTVPGARTDVMTQQSNRMDTGLAGPTPGNGPTRVEAARTEANVQSEFAGRRLVTSPHAHAPLTAPPSVAGPVAHPSAALTREPAISQTPQMPAHAQSQQQQGVAGYGGPSTRPNLQRMSVEPAAMWQTPSFPGQPGTYAPSSFAPESKPPRPAGRGLGFGLVVVALLLILAVGIGTAMYFFRDDLTAAANPAGTTQLAGTQAPLTPAPVPTAASAPQPICAQFRACCDASANLPGLVSINDICGYSPAFVRSNGEAGCAQLLSGIRSTLHANPQMPPVCREQTPSPSTAAPSIAPPVAPTPTPAAAGGANSCAELTACCNLVPTVPALAVWTETCNTLPTFRSLGDTGQSYCRMAIVQIRSTYASTPGIPPQCH